MYENNKVIYNLERCEKLEKTLYLSQFNTYKNFKLASKNCNKFIRDICLQYEY